MSSSAKLDGVLEFPVQLGLWAAIVSYEILFAIDPSSVNTGCDYVSSIPGAERGSSMETSATSLVGVISCMLSNTVQTRGARPFMQLWQRHYRYVVWRTAPRANKLGGQRRLGEGWVLYSLCVSFEG
ncbi:hypothetical protein V6N12_073349 [Hibiscus sabdariffa]|uniref:Uncharacterized protein n=1 Tax=Hibiscus sabdariffa TaxID=183260 RepID=A0ABR1ZVX1_9ROSI